MNQRGDLANAVNEICPIGRRLTCQKPVAMALTHLSKSNLDVTENTLNGVGAYFILHIYVTYFIFYILFR